MLIESPTGMPLPESRWWNAVAFFLPGIDFLVTDALLETYLPGGYARSSVSNSNLVALHFALGLLLAVAAAYFLPWPRWRAAAKWFALGYGLLVPCCALPLYAVWMIICRIDNHDQGDGGNRKTPTEAKLP